MFFEEYNLYEAGDFGYHECRIPALLTTANGTILAFNEARKFTGSDSDQIDLFLRRSFDGGRSFGDVQVVTTKDGWVSGNPVPVQDRTTGTIWLLFCRNRTEKISTLEVPRSIWVTSSNDDGKRGMSPRRLSLRSGLPIGRHGTPRAPATVFKNAKRPHSDPRQSQGDETECGR